MPKVRAFAIDVTTTVLVESVDENGNWVNPLVMMLFHDPAGKVQRSYSLLFSEAEDPFCVPALREHVIMAEYVINDDLEKQYYKMLDMIKEKVALEKSGLVAPTGKNIRDIGSKHRGNA